MSRLDKEISEKVQKSPPARWRAGLIGFTLIELMVALIIVSVLMVLISAGIFRAIESAKIKQAETEISNMEMALRMYESDVRGYPPGGGGFINHFKTYLENRPSGVKNWSGPYMHFEVVKWAVAAVDPWGNPYRYKRNAQHNPKDYFDLWSCGPDGISGTDDDITNW